MVRIDVKLATLDEVSEFFYGLVDGEEHSIKRAVFSLSAGELLGKEGDRLPVSVSELLKDSTNPCTRCVRSNEDRSVGRRREDECGSVSQSLFGSCEDFVRR